MRYALGLIALCFCACDGGSSSAGPAGAPASASAAAALAVPGGAKAPAPEAADAERDAARALAASILVGGQAMKTLTELTDSFGPRLAGSDVHARAAEWARDRFRSYGLDASLETFPLDHGWTRGEATAKLVAPSEHTLHVAAQAWSPGTTGALRAEVVAVDDVSAAVLAKRKDLAGKIVLYKGKRPGPGEHPVVELAKAGAVAALAELDMPRDALMGARCRAAKDATCTIPAFVLGHEDGEMIRRAVDGGAHPAVELTSTAQIGGPVNVPNVIADIKGSDKPQEMVIVGAHLDSWDLATGAQDNGSGCAEVLEAARAVRALGRAPVRTMRFVLWAGEEEGILGSAAYAKAHAKELDGVVAVVNTDHGAGAPVGWNTGGRDDLKTALAPLAKSLLSGLGAADIDAQPTCNTDHCPFMLQGVPTLNLQVEASHYEEIHHLATDTVDKVKEGWLSQGAAAVAVVSYTQAMRDGRLAPRLGHEAVAKSIAGSDFLPYAIAMGMWTP
jgi:hypothetical protein